MGQAHTSGHWLPGPYEYKGHGYIMGPGRSVVPFAELIDDPEDLKHATYRLLAAAPEMAAALENVRKIIADAARTGFNWKDGDWAERLFASQQVTSAALSAARATGGTE